MEEVLFMTHHNTLLYADADGRLRHGSLVHSPRNLLLSVKGGVYSILYIKDGAAEPVHLGHEVADFSFTNGEKDYLLTNLNCIESSGPSVAFRIHDRFLSASPNGNLELGSFQGHWETFAKCVQKSGWQEGTITETVHKGHQLRFFVVNGSDEIQKHHLRGQFYEQEELEIIQENCPPHCIYVEVGANVGNHVIFASKFLEVRQIFAFEPNPKAIQVLKANLALNQCHNVDTRFLGFALADKKANFIVNDDLANNLGASSLKQSEIGSIRAIPGDDLILSYGAGFIKIDAEGMEMSVLKGLYLTIERFKPVIFVEVSDANDLAFKSWVSSASYQIVRRFERYAGMPNYLIKPVLSL